MSSKTALQEIPVDVVANCYKRELEQKLTFAVSLIAR